MADRYQTLQGGKGKMVEATVVSTGVGEAGDILALGPDGKIDDSVLPVGVGPDVKVVEATEALTAGDYVNIFDDAGTPKVRLADNSNGREAHGFVLAAYAITELAAVLFEGSNTAAPVALTGQRAYLGSAGAAITTPLDPATDAGKIHQLLGSYVDVNEVNTDIDDCILL